MGWIIYPLISHCLASHTKNRIEEKYFLPTSFWLKLQFLIFNFSLPTKGAYFSSSYQKPNIFSEYSTIGSTMVQILKTCFWRLFYPFPNWPFTLISVLLHSVFSYSYLASINSRHPSWEGDKANTFSCQGLRKQYTRQSTYDFGNSEGLHSNRQGLFVFRLLLPELPCAFHSWLAGIYICYLQHWRSSLCGLKSCLC